MGYWPDVRIVKYLSNIQTFCNGYLRLVQHSTTGRVIEIPSPIPRLRMGNYEKYPVDAEYSEIIPETKYYIYQEVPIAAYLIPKDLPDGSKVIVKDPIEDIKNGWERAINVPGIIKNRKVILKRNLLKVRQIVD